MGNHLSRRPGRISDDACGEGVATVLIGCRCNPSLICHRKASRHGSVPVRHWNQETAPGAARIDPSGAGGRRKPTRGRSRGKAGDPFGDLPEELLPMILSKLDMKEAAMTSVLSSAWKHAWKLSPRLTLDIFAMFSTGTQRCVQRFMDVVDATLHQRLRDGAVVQQLELRLDAYGFAQVLHRLDDWVRFAVLLQAKGVILHVPPLMMPLQAVCYEMHVFPYTFPLQLLDAGGGTSSLQHVQLSSVSLKVPSPHTQSLGFPNLRKLGLCSAWLPTNDLNIVLSNCSSLEWLDLCMVYLMDGFKVDRPLARLKYLRLADCRVTKIEMINASKLISFILEESLECQLPTPTSILHIDLGGPEFLMPASQLHSVHIHCHMFTLEHALGALPRAFPTVKRLSLHTHILPKFPWRPVNTSGFSRLRSLQLFFTITDQHAGNILSIACILEAAPFLEELDAEFISFHYEFAGQGNISEDPLSSFPHGQCKYKCLKAMTVHNFMGTNGQIELMEHIVENAPALEVLTVDPRRRHVPGIGQINETLLSATRRIATISIRGKLSARTKLIVL
ncbi:hypothetical protein ZWY2020_047203 [Hordeum vulgare]|nr:hypothetical protein ZWY2020_047203 [Hordeum vulgare]